MANPIVTITMENGDVIKAELYPQIAPNTVNNFISLIKKGFYDGLIFHRVIKGFMIQGGCPLGNGTGNPGYSIKGEFSNNGFTNQLKHEAGVLSMARSMMPNSAGSQFFIMHKAAPHLDGEYAAFGKVIEGMDVVDKIASVKTFMDPPYDQQYEKRALEILKDCSFVTEDTLIVVEASLDTDLSYAEALGYTIEKEKIYKTNKHVFIVRS